MHQDKSTRNNFLWIVSQSRRCGGHLYLLTLANSLDISAVSLIATVIIKAFTDYGTGIAVKMPLPLRQVMAFEVAEKTEL